jgi:hypothetical protein
MSVKRDTGGTQDIADQPQPMLWMQAGVACWLVIGSLMRYLNAMQLYVGLTLLYFLILIPSLKPNTSITIVRIKVI